PVAGNVSHALSVNGRRQAVNPTLYARTLAPNDHVVPVVGLESRGQVLRIGFRQELAAARFVIQSAPDRPALHRSHIALIADHLEVIRNSLTAKLHAGVLAFADQASFQ